MNANGFLEQRTSHPLSFSAVLLLHGAAIAAVLLVKGPGWIREEPVVTRSFDVPRVEPPPPVEPPPRPEPEIRQAPVRSVIDVPPRVIDTPVANPPIPGEIIPQPSGPVIGRSRSPVLQPPRPLEEIRPIEVHRPPPEPVRVDAQFDPRFADAQQPPYPAVEQRNEREGAVRVRVTIGPDGRVTAVSQLSATSDAFWRVTERQALGRWRFRPATLDGRPVTATKVMTVHFRLDGR